MQEKKGFTLVELIVTIALLAVVTTIIVVNMVGLKNKEDEKEKTRIESTIKTAAEAYIEVEGLEQSDNTCVNVRQLVQGNYLKEDYVKDYLNNSVKVVKDGDKTTYEIFEGTNCTAQKQEISITFNPGDGVIKTATSAEAASKTVKIEKGGSLKASEIPEAYQKYYAFLGWYEDQKYTKKIDEKTKFNQNTTLYAGYQIKEFSIEYQNEGSNSITQVLRYKENNKLEKNPFSKNGYTFVDWSTKDNGIKNIKDNAVVNETIWNYAWEHNNKIELVANFQANNYTVTLEGNGGSVTPKSKKVTYDSAYGTLPDPSRKYYDFKGWSLKKDVKDIVTSSTKVTMAKDHTLYAMWDLHGYKITLDQNQATIKGSTEVETTYGQTYVSIDPLPKRIYTITVKNNVGATLIGSTNITATYNFKGYYDGNTQIIDIYGDFVKSSKYADSEGKWVYDGDTTLKANWIAPSITLPEVTKEGYTCGFATSSNSNGEKEYDSGSSMTPSKNMNLYTVCEANSSVVTFNANGGSVTPKSKTVKYNSTYGSLPTPTRDGYKFLGWYYNNQKITSSSIVKVASNHTLIARWEASEYSLQVNTLNGTVSAKNIKITDKNNNDITDESNFVKVVCKGDANTHCLKASVNANVKEIKLEVTPTEEYKYILNNVQATNARTKIDNQTVTINNISGDVTVNIYNYKNTLLQIQSIDGNHDFTPYNNSSWKQANQIHLDIKDEKFQGGYSYTTEQITSGESCIEGTTKCDISGAYYGKYIGGVVGKYFIYYLVATSSGHPYVDYYLYIYDTSTGQEYKYNPYWVTADGGETQFFSVPIRPIIDNRQIYFYDRYDSYVLGNGTRVGKFKSYAIRKNSDLTEIGTSWRVERNIFDGTARLNWICEANCNTNNDYLLNPQLYHGSNDSENLLNNGANVWNFDSVNISEDAKEALSVLNIRKYNYINNGSTFWNTANINLIDKNGFWGTDKENVYYFNTIDGKYGVLLFVKYENYSPREQFYRFYRVIYDGKSTKADDYYLNEGITSVDDPNGSNKLINANKYYYSNYYVLDLTGSYGVSGEITMAGTAKRFLINPDNLEYPSENFQNATSAKNLDDLMNQIAQN